ncbi:hypothetical protein [Crossiella sp. NPDC003009]
MRLAAIAFSVFVSLAGLAPVAAAGATACPSVNGNWASSGPFAVTSASNGTGHTIFRPSQLGSLGCARHPVLLWSNGGPALFTAGQNDLLVGSPVVWSQYARAGQVPAVFGELRGAGHLAGIELRGPVTAWFRWHLMGDGQARGLFFGAGCGYCGAGAGTPWSKFERNAKAEAVLVR